MPDFIFYAYCAFNISIILLVWALSSRANDLKNHIKQLEEVVDRKQERYDGLKERYNKLLKIKGSDVEDSIVEDNKEIVQKEDYVPKNLWVFYTNKQCFGVSVDEGTIKDGSVYKKFIKWFYSTEKPSFTFHYSNGATTTILRSLISHFEVK